MQSSLLTTTATVFKLRTLLPEWERKSVRPCITLDHPLPLMIHIMEEGIMARYHNLKLPKILQLTILLLTTLLITVTLNNSILPLKAIYRVINKVTCLVTIWMVLHRLKLHLHCRRTMLLLISSLCLIYLELLKFLSSRLKVTISMI